MPRKPLPAFKPHKGNLPSAEEVLNFITLTPSVVGKREIATAFGLQGEAKIALKKLLKDMAGAGKVAPKRKRVAPKNTLPSTGVIEVTGEDKDGELIGTFVNDAGVAWPAPLMVVSAEGKAPKRGDRVVAKIEALPHHPVYRHKAKVMRVLPASARGRLLGVFKLVKGKGARIIPVEKKARQEYQVLAADEGGATSGELVAFEIIREHGFGLPAAKVRELLGDLNDPRNISLIAINQHGIPNRFPEKVLAETEDLKPFDEQMREDFTSVPLITIDPADARDHDDAVFAEPDDA